MIRSRCERVRNFWIDEVGPKGWYAQDDALDARIRDEFEPLWEEAAKGDLRYWCSNPEDMLAYIIITDQFPRNMFRGQGKAFSTDARARKTAHWATGHGWDLEIPVPQRQFFYLPFMHSEYIADQDRSVRLFKARMPESPDNLRHAIAHREVIRRYGRFPYRNEALGRESRPDEQEFLDAGGYAAILKEFA